MSKQHTMPAILWSSKNSWIQMWSTANTFPWT